MSMTTQALTQKPEQYLNDAELRFQTYSDGLPAERERKLATIDADTEARIKGRSWNMVKKVGAPVVAAAAIATGIGFNQVSSEPSESQNGLRGDIAARVEADTITRTQVINGHEATIAIAKEKATIPELLAQHQAETGEPVADLPK